MDMRRLTVVLVAVVAAVQLGCDGVWGKFVFKVESKFKVSGIERTWSAVKAHDTCRHGRFLSAVDISLGGNGLANSSYGLYFTKIGLGTPSMDYYLQVDTGSDYLWVYCASHCDGCPSKSDLGLKLTRFDPHKSRTSSVVGCDDAFCLTTDGQLYGCKSGLHCLYSITYGDGSGSFGYFVKDDVQLNQATANAKTSPFNASIIFGCGTKQTGGLASDTVAAVDGILGLGQANSSMLSQLAAAGKVRKEFAHCLDVVKGGGIFAIGDVVSPTVKTSPLLQRESHYAIRLKAVEVGGRVLDVLTNAFDTGVVIDSGTTLAYLPQLFYQPLITQIIAQHHGSKLGTLDCFQFGQNVDDAFPNVTFQFEGSLTLTVYPHDYLYEIDNEWCFGWQSSTGLKSPDGREMIILGDLVLSNKLVVYDIENQTIGWTEYNCTSSIKVKDEESGLIYTVGTHNLSAASTLKDGMLMLFSALSLTVGKVFMTIFFV